MSNGTDVKPPAASERRMVAWIGKAVRVEGKVIGGEDLTIDGDVEGSIELGGHSLTIGQEATIKADLLAKTVIISGKVKGNIKGVEKVDLSSTALGRRRHHRAALRMADGATVIGKIQAAKRSAGGR